MRPLLSLPNLRTIWFRHDVGKPLQKLIQDVVEVSPKVQDVRMYWSSFEASPYRVVHASNSWTFGDSSVKSRLGRLRVLQLAGLPGVDLQSWACVTDFAHLRVLSLEVALTRADLAALAEFSFQALRSVTIVLINPKNNEEQYNAAAKTFFCGLSPLEALRITGDLQFTTLRLILEQRGSALNSLHLIPGGKKHRFVFDWKSIDILPITCGRLQNLSITLPRNWRIPHGTMASLKILASLPRLERLDLTFDAAGPAVQQALRQEQDAVFSTGEMEMFATNPWGPNRARHFYNILKNSAIDAALAEEVFAAITSANQSSRLRCLSLEAKVVGHFDGVNWDVIDMAEELGWRWTVERLPYGTGLEVWRKEKKGFCFSDNEDDEELERLPFLFEDIFRRIWPGSGNWKEEWRAVPLGGCD